MSGGLQAAWELLGFPAIVGLEAGLANSRKPMGESPNGHVLHDLSTDAAGFVELIPYDFQS